MSHLSFEEIVNSRDLLRCDKNEDGRLNVDELEMRIKEKKNEHMDETIKEARELMTQLDMNKDGKVWQFNI